MDNNRTNQIKYFENMNVKNKSKNLISQGYIPFRILKDQKPPTNSIDKYKKQHLYEKYYGVLFYKHNEDKPDDIINIYFNKKEDYNYLNKLISNNLKEKIKGFDLYIYCSIVGIMAGHGRQYNIDKLINSFKTKWGWNVEQYEKTNTFFIYFELKKDENFKKYFKKVNQILQVLSLRNHIGIKISDYSIDPFFKNIPVRTQGGLETTNALGINDNDLEIISNIHFTKDEKLQLAVNSLREYYGQFTNPTKFLIGWSAVEEIFSSKSKHILKKRELSEIIKLVEKCEINDEQKKLKLIEVIKNPDILSEQNRNVRIARNISKCLNFDYEKIYDQISEVSKFRGKFAHQISGDLWEKFESKKVKNMRDKLLFLEILLKLYIEKKSNLNFNYEEIEKKMILNIKR